MLTNVSQTDISVGVIAGLSYPFPNTTGEISGHYSTFFLLKYGAWIRERVKGPN